MEQAIEKIPAMTDTSDVELYVQSLENELIQAGVPREWWKSLLTPRLIPVLKDHIGDLQAEPATSMMA